MGWLILCIICIISAAIALVVWQRWIAPWPQIDQLVRQIVHGKEPRTFLVNGGIQAQRVGLALENIFRRQQQLAEQIAGRESGTQTILDVMQDGLLVVDSRRRVALSNPAFEKMFELRDGSVGAPLLEVVRHATLDRLIADTLRSGQPMRTELSLTNSPAGGERHLEVSAVPIKAATEGTTGAVVLFHDITELKRLDQVRSDFVANVSHELRTPLSILRGYIETLLDNPETSREEFSRVLSVMERHSKRLGLLVDDLLSLAQLESSTTTLEIEQVRLPELFDHILRDWKKKLGEKNLKVLVNLPPDAPLILGDETRLQYVLYNLLQNAEKYSRQNGEIRLQAAQRRSEIVLSVSDDGIGISKNDLPRIFERFYRADKARSRELGVTRRGPPTV